ncbi:hypothetical protein [Nitrospina watsonii]|uniref:DUF3311 domain-containing protein n=1 Tax=Nitrospina watsonii TaxID=1323948 RepID=A0ABM9HAQ6_9BACT|nr:hypothetical protein [Nitrospina watsonii]CAI2717208.1 conserved protein of unknown function [Nitrospina watsonii]
MSKPSSSQKPTSHTVSDALLPRWVWGVFLLLIVAMLPVWPLAGRWFGVPAWAAFALLVSVVTSGFIAWVTLFVWKNPDDDEDSAA